MVFSLGLVSLHFVLNTTATHTRTTFNPRALDFEAEEHLQMFHLVDRMSIICGTVYDHSIVVSLGLFEQAEESLHLFGCGWGSVGLPPRPAEVALHDPLLRRRHHGAVGHQ